MSQIYKYKNYGVDILFFSKPEVELCCSFKADMKLFMLISVFLFMLGFFVIIIVKDL